MARTFGDRLRRTREKARVSGRELAALAGVSPGSVSAIETGTTTRPQAPTLMAIARVLGVSAEYLLEGEGEAPTPEHVRAHVIEARKGQRLTA